MIVIILVGASRVRDEELTDAQAIWCQQNLDRVALAAERLGLGQAHELPSLERGEYAGACRAAFELR